MFGSYILYVKFPFSLMYWSLIVIIIFHCCLLFCSSLVLWVKFKHLVTESTVINLKIKQTYVIINIQVGNITRKLWWRKYLFYLVWEGILHR